MSKPVAAAAGCLLAALVAGGPAGAEQVSAGLLGDWSGARQALAARGLFVTLDYAGELFGISGGWSAGRTASTYEGRLGLGVALDLEQAFGWQGASVEAKGFQIHSAHDRNAAARVGSIADPSNIDGTSTTRLFTFALQQKLGFGSLKLGKLAADDDFLLSPTAGGLLNGTFGWATMMSANMPSGGPAYPLAAPGARLQIDAADNIALLAAAYAGNPAGKNCTLDDVQLCDRHSTKFSLAQGALVIGEVQVTSTAGEGMAGVYKIGTWRHVGGEHADQRYGLQGGVRVPLSLEPPEPLNHKHNWGVYGVADQTVWQKEETSIGLFLRAGFAPSDRNLVSRYVDGGVGFKGLIAGRADDTLTIGVAHARISRAAANADRDAGRPRRSGETLFEVSYAAQIMPGWTVQPDFQYIARPAGGALRDDADPASGRLPAAKLFGVRMTLSF